MAWLGLIQSAKAHVKTCTICQKSKKSTIKYGHLPPKNAEGTPWQILCVDLVGPYTVTLTKEKVVTLHAMTFIDPATGWFEICAIPDKYSSTMSQHLNNVWFSRYPRPRKIIFDNGPEFKKDFRHIFKDYGVKTKPTTIKKPQANSILERVHLVLANMLRASNIANLQLSTEDPWTEVLASVAYAIRSTYHTTLQATPAQLVFGRDMIYPLQYIAEWDVIRKRKQALIDKNNERENSKRVDFDYIVGQRVLLLNTDLQRKLDDPTQGPFKIVQTHTNGNVSILRGSVIERVNVRRIKPYFEK
jgi:transposase InsO family protein